jgi:hypothetical protein
MQMWADVSAGSVAAGETRSVTIVNAGQQARFTFASASGDQLGFALSDVAIAAGGVLSFYNPSGINILNQAFTASGIQGSRLPQLPAGTYTVVVVPNSSGTGSLKFTLWKDVSGGALVIDATTPTPLAITYPAQQGRFTFTSSGASLGFNLTGVTLASGGVLSFYNPSGINILNQAFTMAGIQGSRLPQLPAGTYSIVVVPNSNGTGSVSMQMWADVNAGSVAPGETKTVSIVNGAQQARITFSSASGDQLGFALSDVTLAAVGVLRYALPSVINILNQAFAASGIQGSRLPQLPPGSYTVVVVPNSSGTGSFQFTLWKDATGTLALGTPFDLALPFPTQQARLSFAGTVAQNLALVIASPTFPKGGTVQVLNPSGAPITTASFGAGGSTVNIPPLGADGTYSVVVTPASNGTGTATVTLGTP